MSITKETLGLYEEFPEIKDIKNGFFFECGANDGIYYSVCHDLEASLGWTGINVECNPFVWEDLQKNRPNCINLNYALSNTDNKELAFMIPRNDHENRDLKTGNASLHFLPVHWRGLKIDSFTVKTISIPTILEKYNVDHIDIFALDVEGHEKTVLQDLSAWKVKPEIFCIEWVLWIHGGRGRRDAMKAFMSQHGYKFRRRQGHNLFFKKQQYDI
jgi:FkbM family methyltransferase